MTIASPTDPPLVSVVIPTFNDGKYLAQALSGVLKQSYPKLQVIVVVDGSSDSTKEVLASFDDPRLVVIWQENTGIVGALNRGFAAVTGTYIARMDADDLIAKDRIEKQLKYLQDNPEVVACGTDYEMFGDKNGIIRMPRNPNVATARFLFGTAIAHPSALFRAAPIKLSGLKFKQEYEYAEDFKFFSELTAWGKIANLPFVGLRYRSHAEQISSAKVDKQKEISKRITVENFASKGIKVSQDLVEAWLWPSGRGLKACVKYLTTNAPSLLWYGFRGAKLAGFLTALQLLRERINTILRGA